MALSHQNVDDVLKIITPLKNIFSNIMSFDADTF